MRLVDEESHVALAYVRAVTRTGTRLTAADLKAFIEEPTRRRGGAAPTSAMRQMVRTLASALNQLDLERVPGESMLDFLVRVRWVVSSADGSVTLSPVGRAVLADVERPEAPDSADDPLVVQIDPADPIAYYRVFELMAMHGPGMLIDPYIDVAGLADLADISHVNRVLTSNRAANRRLELLARVAPDAPRIETRTVAASSIHDRFFFPDEGPVYVLGSSLNSISRRPGVITPVTDPAAAGAMRSAYEGLWSDAVPLAAPEAGGAQPS